MGQSLPDSSTHDATQDLLEKESKQNKAESGRILSLAPGLGVKIRNGQKRQEFDRIHSLTSRLGLKYPRQRKRAISTFPASAVLALSLTWRSGLKVIHVLKWETAYTWSPSHSKLDARARAIVVTINRLLPGTQDRLVQ